jgi:hypothetical protein
LRELEADERAPRAWNTVYDAKSVLEEAMRLREKGPGLGVRLRLEPGRYGIYPLTKSGANPWRDRITVGRATNNDVVLRPGSVSKLHAYFQTNAPPGPDGRSAPKAWLLYDCKSANGTRIEAAGQTKSLTSGTPEEIVSGAILYFGAVMCEFIDSGPLYDAL